MRRQSNKEKVYNKHNSKQVRGMSQESEISYFKSEKYDTSWFKPMGRQQEIFDAVDEKDWVIVQGASGCGKTTCVIAKSLKLLGGHYRKIVFIKNPTEAGDDQIGFLTGDADTKLTAHFDAMRNIFLDFMSKGKLESDEKNGNIDFKIPNFMLGCTLSNSIVIIDEAQTFSPNTLKLLMERVDDSCKLIILGDKNQRYSAKKREDGFTDFIKRVTVVEDGVRYSKEDLLEYIELTSAENQRGAISKRVVELYSEN